MSHKVNRIGKRYGKLFVLGKDRAKTREKKRFYWRCVCDCGRKTSTTGTMLEKGLKQNCRKCGQKKGALSNLKHGHSRKGHITIEYCLWCNARARAKRNGLPCTIRVEDIRVPEFCPVFPWIRLETGTRMEHDNSPSLDQIIPGLGYIPDNVWVISYRANRIKHNATLEELEALVTALKNKVVADVCC